MQANLPPSISASVRKNLNDATNVFVLTGAGISAESDVPTFRGGGGSMVWKGMPFSVISTVEIDDSNPEEVWEWFEDRRNILRIERPNPAHFTLSNWKWRFDNLTSVTQNFGGLHHETGSAGVIELHGNIWKARCQNCGFALELRAASDSGSRAVCQSCTGKMRPDVALFGEMLPASAFENASEAAEKCDVCLIVGTSGMVYPADALLSIAKRAGSFVVEINCEETSLSQLCDEVIKGKAGDVAPLL